MDESLILTRTLEALDDYGQEVAAMYKKNLYMADKKSSGNLINHIEVKIANSAMGLEYLVILNLEDYWKYVEKGLKGAKNHNSPYKAPAWRKAYPHILNWITEKPVVKRPMENGKLPTDKQLAAMISKGIEKYGIKEGNYLRNTIEQVNAYYLPILEEALSQDWEEYSLYILKDVNRMIKI